MNRNNERKQRAGSPPRYLRSRGSIGFIVMRLMLLFGHFNYGRKGLLDITHKRLFSIHTFKNLLEQTGFKIYREYFILFPFVQLALPISLATLLEKINIFLIKIRPRLFAYQILVEAKQLSFPEI